MQSEVLKSLGLGTLDIAYLFIGLLVLFLIVLSFVIMQTVQLGKLNKKYQKFMQGKDVKSLEEELIGVFEDNRFLKIASEENRKNICKIYKKMEHVYQKVGIVKYDAFREMGGKLSFSLALLNDNNSGFIMNSVHSTDGCYSYTKEIVNGECKISLGEEEEKALQKAMNSGFKKQKTDGE